MNGIDFQEKVKMAREAFVKALEDSGEYQSLLSGVPQTHGMRSGRVYLLAGDDCGEHSTGRHEEMLVFLQGCGHAVINNEKRFEVSRGMVTYIPPETVHNIENTSDSPLSYIYCVAPVGFDGRCKDE